LGMYFVQLRIANITAVLPFTGQQLPVAGGGGGGDGFLAMLILQLLVLLVLVPAPANPGFWPPRVLLLRLWQLCVRV